MCHFKKNEQTFKVFIEIHFTKQNFKLNNSVPFCVFAILLTHYICLVPKKFYYPEKKPMPIKILLPTCPLPPTSPWQPPRCILSLWIYLFWTFHVNRIISYVIFCFGFFLLSILSYSFIHIVGVPHLFLWVNDVPLCICMTICFYIHQVVGIEAIVSNAIMNMNTQVFEYLF